MKPITCFIAQGNTQDVNASIHNFMQSNCVEQVHVMPLNTLVSSAAIEEITEKSNTPYTLICTSTHHIELGQCALQRLLQVAEGTKAGMTYTDYYEQKGETSSLLPTIDYQDGSLRDDFNFGALQLYNTKALASTWNKEDNYTYAALYNLRLKVSQQHRIFHLSEPLYTIIETDLRKSGEKIFDYVDPKNRAIQIEMEAACTQHLKAIHAYVAPNFKAVDLNSQPFTTEASVIIPVRNRAKTISDAITSVLSQECAFPFNLIIVDNYSNDGTTEIIARYAAHDSRIIHIIPKNRKLGIGGCWNEAVISKHCGKFAIQLDSDDLYINNNTIQCVVDTFYKEQCAMVVGSYQMVNAKLEEIPPGLIDHKEWTPENGTNNALRINGLGAPRAFYTPLFRQCLIPNTSYGEDYAIGLYLSAKYKLGRIYHPLYLCRRWEENSDNSLDIHKTNAHNSYKDKIRTIELYRRML